MAIMGAIGKPRVKAVLDTETTVIMGHGPEEKLAALPIKDGQITYGEKYGTQFIDIKNKRITKGEVLHGYSSIESGSPKWVKFTEDMIATSFNNIVNTGKTLVNYLQAGQKITDGTNVYKLIEYKINDSQISLIPVFENRDSININGNGVPYAIQLNNKNSSRESSFLLQFQYEHPDTSEMTAEIILVELTKDNQVISSLNKDSCMDKNIILEIIVEKYITAMSVSLVGISNVNFRVISYSFADPEITHTDGYYCNYKVE